MARGLILVAPGAGYRDQSKGSLSRRGFETRRATGRDISHARSVLCPRFLYYSSLMEKRHLAMCMWLCEGKLKQLISGHRPRLKNARAR